MVYDQGAWPSSSITLTQCQPNSLMLEMTILSRSSRVSRCGVAMLCPLWYCLHGIRGMATQEIEERKTPKRLEMRSALARNVSASGIAGYLISLTMRLVTGWLYAPSSDHNENNAPNCHVG